MSKLVMRFFFCAIPAIIIGIIVSVLFNTALGVTVSVIVFSFGFDVTQAKLERGENVQ